MCEAQDTAVEGEDRISVWFVYSENKMRESLGLLCTGRRCWLDLEFQFSFSSAMFSERPNGNSCYFLSFYFLSLLSHLFCCFNFC